MDEMKMVTNISYSLRDCCSCGNCPHCGTSIDDWISGKTCRFCGKPIAWTWDALHDNKFHKQMFSGTEEL